MPGSQRFLEQIVILKINLNCGKIVRSTNILFESRDSSIHGLMIVGSGRSVNNPEPFCIYLLMNPDVDKIVQ